MGESVEVLSPEMCKTAELGEMKMGGWYGTAVFEGSEYGDYCRVLCAYCTVFAAAFAENAENLFLCAVVGGLV